MSKSTTLPSVQRKDWVDVLRALAMLFVIYGHFYRQSAAYFVFTSPIKIPLFFAVSGYLFNDRNGNIKEFLLKLLKRIVIPWLCLTMVTAVVYIPFKGWGYFSNFVIQILIGEQYWYMPCCIIAEIIFMLSKKFTCNLYQLSVVSLLLTVVGYVLSRLGAFELFKFDTALIVQGFLLIGFLFRKNEPTIQKTKIWVPIACVSMYIILGILSLILYPGRSLDVNNNSYYNIPLCATMIALGCFALFSIAPKIKWYPRSLVFVGCNTLVFYIFHSYGRAIVDVGLRMVGVTLPDAWYVAVGMMVVVCTGCGIGAVLLNWLLPEAVGKNRIKKVNV